METDPARKTCKMCCMEIPNQARKCPYCQCFQNWLSTVVLHPGVAVLFVCVPMAAIVFYCESVFDAGENYETYKDQIVITESQIAFGDTKAGATVAVLGTITNSSAVPWKEIQFHADFFDAQGRRTDVGEREDYHFRLPANSISSFKVSFRREFLETDYLKHTVRVVAAKDARAKW